MLKVGDKAPDFSSKLADGTAIRLRDVLAKGHAVLYFFPKDFTPGCTKEACSFRDHHGEIKALGAEIYGVSLDSQESHQAFAQEHKLPFPLISDEDKSVAKSYEALRLGGWLLTWRITYVIDKTGVIRHVISSELNMGVHIDEAVEALKKL